MVRYLVDPVEPNRFRGANQRRCSNRTELKASAVGVGIEPTTGVICSGLRTSVSASVGEGRSNSPTYQVKRRNSHIICGVDGTRTRDPLLAKVIFSLQAVAASRSQSPNPWSHMAATRDLEIAGDWCRRLATGL